MFFPLFIKRILLSCSFYILIGMHLPSIFIFFFSYLFSFSIVCWLISIYNKKHKLIFLIQNKDIYDILLKNKTEKARESETKRKEAEDTSAAVDVFLGKSNLAKMKADQKEDYASRNQNKQIKDSSKMEQKRNMSEKLRVSLKHLILCLERESNWRRSGSLLQAYLKQN